MKKIRNLALMATFLAASGLAAACGPRHEPMKQPHRVMKMQKHEAGQHPGMEKPYKHSRERALKRELQRSPEWAGEQKRRAMPQPEASRPGAAGQDARPAHGKKHPAMGGHKHGAQKHKGAERPAMPDSKAGMPDWLTPM